MVLLWVDKLLCDSHQHSNLVLYVEKTYTDIHDDMWLYVTSTNSTGEDKILSYGKVSSLSDSIIIPMGQTLQKYQSGIIDMYEIFQLKTGY